jgi:hypothetical protein
MIHQPKRLELQIRVSRLHLRFLVQMAPKLAIKLLLMPMEGQVHQARLLLRRQLNIPFQNGMIV